MKYLIIICLVFTISALAAVDELYLSGLNEASYIYRTAQDSLNSYFRDAYSFSIGYKDFTLGAKFLAELPKYSTDQNQLMHELNPNRLTTAWTERYLEFERDNLLLRGGNITESFSSGMVLRAYQDVEFDTDTRLDGFLVRYDNKLKLKALYGALPNLDQPAKSDLAYGADAEYPVWGNFAAGASILTMRTLNPLGIYNQQDVLGGRVNWTYDLIDGGAEYATTSLYKNAGANRKGSAINAYANLYLNPVWVKSLTLGVGYKKYDNYRYRLQDLKTFNYHNETLADNLPSGSDEEGLQGSASASVNDKLSLETNYAEAWNSAYSKRMNDLFLGGEYQWGEKSLLFEYGHIEKLDKTTDHWQKEIRPAVSYSQPWGSKSVTLKLEDNYYEKVTAEVKSKYFEPQVQADLGMGKLSVSLACRSRWTSAGSIANNPYWANCELRYSLFEHTDLTLFVGRQEGGKVCRNGICRYVAPFQGVRLDAFTRF